MNTTVQQYIEANQALESIVDAVPTGSWSEPSPCEGWAARDVVGHLIQTQRDFLTGQDLDPGPAPNVEADAAAAWHHHAQRAIGILHDDSAVATGYDGYFGPTTVGDTLEQFYIWDMLVHRWDIATSAGLDAGLTGAELDRIDRGADIFGENLHMEGICKPAVDAASEDRKDRVLARLGRLA